jgi:hypothetical protein
MIIFTALTVLAFGWLAMLVLKSSREQEGERVVHSDGPTITLKHH